MPNGMDSGSSNALVRNKRNASNRYTAGPITFGISNASDMGQAGNWNAGQGESTGVGTYYPLSGVGQTTYDSAAMASSASLVQNSQPFPGFEIDILNIG